MLIHVVPGWSSMEEPVFSVPNSSGWILGLRSLLDLSQIKTFGLESRHHPVQNLLALGKTAVPLLSPLSEVLGLIVASLEPVPYSQFHPRPLQFNILAVWDKTDSVIRPPRSSDPQAQTALAMLDFQLSTGVREAFSYNCGGFTQCQPVRLGYCPGDPLSEGNMGIQRKLAFP